MTRSMKSDLNSVPAASADVQAARRVLRLEIEGIHALSETLDDSLDAALDLLRRARYIDEDHAEVLIALSQAYQRAGDEKRAEQFAKAIRPGHDVTRRPDPYLHEFVFGADAR